VIHLGKVAQIKIKAALNEIALIDNDDFDWKKCYAAICQRTELVNLTPDLIKRLY
jgi:hypothetical protein